jgi:DNA-binding XRE family transcriptional regulator
MVHARKVKTGVEVTFADGCKGTIPFANIPEIGKSSRLAGIELPNLYQIILYDATGESVDIPWDFARHYCDPLYQANVEESGASGKKLFGQRLRQLRESAGVTQKKLAEAAGVGRVTLVRIENGEQSPRYETIIALARALDVPPERLVVEA